MGQQPTVLIVSDFLENTENIQRYLLENPEFTCRILLEKSASAGILLCKREQVNLILLNYSLPDSNGLEFLGQLRVLLSNNCPPVVMLGKNDAVLAVKAIKNGAEDYLVRQQLTKELLIKTVSSAIAISQQRQNQACVNVAELNYVETLRDSEDKSGFILNNLNISISRFWVFANREWEYDYYSPGCETVFGYTSQELVADKNLWQSRVLPSFSFAS